MKENGTRTLTQDELVAGLHELGYIHVNKRRVSSWRENELIPPFDISGSGRGPGRGRECSKWLNGDAVLQQAMQVCELLTVYKSFEEVYLPLWISGYSVPLKLVRESLRTPLDQAIRDASVEVDGRSAIEDEIFEAAHQFTDAIQKKNLKLFDVPPETLEAMTNVILNGDYNLNDGEFEYGAEKLQEWSRSFHQNCARIFGDEVAESASKRDPADSWIFDHAAFINQYLSVPHLKQALDECTDQDLITVQRDLQFGREILRHFQRLLEFLMPYLPEQLKPITTLDLAMLFDFAKLAIWIDLSLRRSGYGEVIDYLLPLMLNEIERQPIADLEQEISTVGPQMTSVLETLLKEFGDYFDGGDSPTLSNSELLASKAHVEPAETSTVTAATTVGSPAGTSLQFPLDHQRSLEEPNVPAQFLY